MAGRAELSIDLAGLVVPLAGRLVATGDRWEPYRLVDPDGAIVGSAGAYFGHLQAAGRAELTVRSSGTDLLRWFRFAWAAGLAWDRATRSDARDFCRWLQLHCALHWPDPAQRNRIAEIRDTVTARITEADREGWLGEAEGLKISLAGAEDKLAQIDRRTSATTPSDSAWPPSARTAAMN